MNKHIIALLIFVLAAILIFINIILLVNEPTYLEEDEVVSELQIS
ncbi:hypothetical protein R2F61_07905 [Mollicutes bacterium LVI A0078]|nr:hypothetical protein RZE84_07680 [Mollicutes bacterium LVI A0075]WOO90642.1 hypothetical protein R2F61_07905 [Mollicutes bacterium LVI A0078]